MSRGTRPSIDDYFMNMARLVASRSTCLRRTVGAVLVKDKRVLATGYNGAPKNFKHCTEVGCLREKLRIKSGERQELCRGIHAEQNTVIQAALFGVSVKGATLYSTTYPCITCAKTLINAGIKEIVYEDEYEDELGKQFLNEAGITVRRYASSIV